MSWLHPPIEKVIESAGNKYILCSLVSKRAKELEKDIPEVIENSQEKAISLAAREVHSGKIIASKIDNK